jgi:glycosyltransferase involved in cell wall biosynthesis
MDLPHFVIAVPSFNRASLLEPLLATLQRQTVTNWHLLIQDDCSSDNTRGEVARLAATDNRVLYRCADVNQGCNAARNALLDWAKTSFPASWMVMLDDDDGLLDDALATLLTTISKYPDMRWITTTCTSNDPKKPSGSRREGRLNYLRDYMFGKTITGDLLHCICVDVLGEQRFTDRFRSGEEWYFFSQLASEQDLLMVVHPCAAKNYQVGGLSAQGINRSRKQQVLELKIEALEPLVGIRPLVHQCVSLAALHLSEHRLSDARYWLQRVRQATPFYLRQYRHWYRLHKATSRQA